MSPVSVLLTTVYISRDEIYLKQAVFITVPWPPQGSGSAVAVTLRLGLTRNPQILFY